MSKLSVFFPFSLPGASLPGRDKWYMWIQTRTTSRSTCMTIVFTLIELSLQSSQQCPLCVCNRLLHVCKQQPACVFASFLDFPIPHTQLEMRLTTLHDVLFASNLYCMCWPHSEPPTPIPLSVAVWESAVTEIWVGTWEQGINFTIYGSLGLKPIMIHHPLLCFRRLRPERQIRESVDAFQHCKNELAQGVRDTLGTRKQ